MTETCPKCGGNAVLLQVTEEPYDFPDPSTPDGKVQRMAKVEEFRCQEESCEHEFEKIIKEPMG